MDALPNWIGELEVRLGHRALLEAALVNARVPKASPPAVLQLNQLIAIILTQIAALVVWKGASVCCPCTER